MHPWYKGYNGSIELDDSGVSYTVTGIYEVKDDEVEITELPIGKWTRDYKDFLAEMDKNNEILYNSIWSNTIYI